MPLSSKLPVPHHTEILVAECDCVVGFFIPDNPSKGAKTSVICAAIQRWVSYGSAQPGGPSVAHQALGPGHGCFREETADLIGRQEVERSPGTYRRLGDRRVISCSSCCSWTSECKDETVTIA